MEIESLLEDISAESPSGENLEYDSEFTELERLLQGKPERVMGDKVIPAEPPKWGEVQKKSLALFSRTKDLRVALALSRALLRLRGLVGLSEGLALFRGLVTRHWESVYPELDRDDNNDPTERINTLVSLCDSQIMLHSVREAPLVHSKIFGRFSLRDILIASGAEGFVGNPGDSPPELSAIEAAFTDSSIEAAESIVDAVDEGIEHILAIESFVTEKVTSEKAPNFDNLLTLFKEIKSVLSEQIRKHGGADTAKETSAIAERLTITDSETKRPNVTTNSGEITSREDVNLVLDKVIHYYKRHEPSSPVPFLLDRAKQLISKDFMEIVSDLVPAGVQQAKAICGPDHKK